MPKQATAADLYVLLADPPQTKELDASVQSAFDVLVAAFKKVPQAALRAAQKAKNDALVAKLPAKWRDRVNIALTAKRAKEAASGN